MFMMATGIWKWMDGRRIVVFVLYILGRMREVSFGMYIRLEPF